MNNSVRNIAQIAKKYGYKMEIVHISQHTAFLSISDNFLKSPYPSHMTSVCRSARYVEGMYERFS